VHAAAAVASWSAARGEGPLMSLIGVLGLPGLLAATAGTGLFCAVAGLSVRAARRRVSYEAWHGIHLLVYIAVALSFLHELAGPNLAGFPVVQVLWTLMHAWVLALVLRHRVVAPLEFAWRHRLRVEAVRGEADGVVSLILRGRHLEELDAEAGQFFRWRFLTPATWWRAHPFSLSAPPHREFLRITVKALGSGSRLVQSVRPGTLVIPEGPSGAMTADRSTQPSVLLIAGGVGITPMRALFESLERGPGQLTLLYRASRPTDVVFRAELERIATHRGARIVWMIGPSSDPALAITGWNLRRLVPGLAECDVYLCASPGLAQALRSALHHAGVPHRRIHEEVFSF
jgi:ferredoxin-NADP reductase